MRNTDSSKFKAVCDQIERIEFSIPYNSNTSPVFKMLHQRIYGLFGGYSRLSSRKGGMYNDGSANPAPENIVVFIIYTDSSKTKTDSALNEIANILISSGEKEFWPVRSTMDRTKYLTLENPEDSDISSDDSNVREILMTNQLSS